MSLRKKVLEVSKADNTDKYNNVVFFFTFSRSHMAIMNPGWASDMNPAWIESLPLFGSNVDLGHDGVGIQRKNQYLDTKLVVEAPEVFALNILFNSSCRNPQAWWSRVVMCRREPGRYVGEVW